VSRKKGGKPVFTITLRRANGRWVKEATRHSKYAAKTLAQAWEEAHDSGYYVEITP